MSNFHLAENSKDFIVSDIDMKVPVSFSALCRRSQNSVTNTKKDDRKCHKLSPMYEDKTLDPTCRNWMFKMTACHPSELLYGPACLLDSRVVIYPCERYKCVIICPCGLCSGLISSESEYCSVQDRFEDHQQYHSAPHHNCAFCAEMFSLIPGFYCRKLITVSEGSFPFHSSRFVLKKAYEFGHTYNYSTSKKSLSCEECGKLFKKASNRERHFRNVHYQQKHECVQCGKLFGRPDNLKKHMEVHVQKGLGSASTADNTDSDNDPSDEGDEMEHTFDRNTEESDMESDSSNCCSQQAVITDDVAEAHDGFSEATSADSESINLGLDTSFNNIEDSPMSNITKCENCDKAFSSKSNLSAHKRKVKYSCGECPDSFCSKIALSAHMKSEHGKQALQCSDCENKFSTKQHLERHIENKSSNPCGQCSAVFCNAHALKGHVYSDHTCKKCHICGVDYEYLNLHIESVHDNTSKTK